MKSVSCIAILLTFTLMIFAGVRHQPPLPEVYAYGKEYFKKQEEALVSWGYQVKQRSELTPTPWERNTFNLQNKRSIFVKSRRPVPGEANTYYRFTLTEETYPEATSAKNRLAHLFQKPPDFNAQDEYSFALRIGYQLDNFVYVIGTDAILFEKEMQRLAKQLQKALP